MVGAGASKTRRACTASVQSHSTEFTDGQLHSITAAKKMHVDSKYA